MSIKKRAQKPNGPPAILRVASDPFFTLEKIEQPYRPERPFILPNKPLLLDPLVNVPQLALIVRGDVVAQCNAPTNPLDFNDWQQVTQFFINAMAMVVKQQ